MTKLREVQEMWRDRWTEKKPVRPSCFNRPAYADIVVSQEFGIEYQQRTSKDCPQWKPGGNADSMPMCDSRGGLKTPWSACSGCIWKTNNDR